MVDPDERSAANGVTNVVRSLGASLAPYCAVMLYASPVYKNYPWYIAGGLKTLYDVLLLWSFHAVKPDSERPVVVVAKDMTKNGNVTQATALLSNYKKTGGGDVEMNKQ